MQTIYTTSPCLLKRTAPIVDLAEYRRKLAQKQQPVCAPVSQPTPESPVCIPQPRPRTDHTHRGALVLDICASLCVCVMTLAFTVQVLNF